MFVHGFALHWGHQDSHSSVPKKYLSELELTARGDKSGVVHLDEEGVLDMLAFVWMDRDRRYFIANTSSLADGTPYKRVRWRQVNETPNALPERVTLTIPQPKVAEIYYFTCGKIDMHNRCRQQDLRLERKLKTTDWSQRVNLTLLAMCIVDSWLCYSQCTKTKETQKEFYTSLAEELIDNNFDNVRHMRRSPRSTPTQFNMCCKQVQLVDQTGAPRAGVNAHLTPTKRKRKNKDGQELSYSLQGRCKVCKSKTTYVCSQCKDDNPNGTEPWLCHSNKGKMCFANHMRDFHGAS